MLRYSRLSFQLIDLWESLTGAKIIFCANIWEYFILNIFLFQLSKNLSISKIMDTGVLFVGLRGQGPPDRPILTAHEKH